MVFKHLHRAKSKVGINRKIINLYIPLHSTLVLFRTLCTMCQFRQSYNRFTLRGLCLDSKHDTVFFLERTLGAMPYFKGISSSIIRWNITRNTWVLNHLRYTAPAYLADDPVVSVFFYQTFSCRFLNPNHLFQLTF